ncbi:MAG: hypothetical protein ABH833_03335 [Parcubacteria group bacterium]
MPSKEYFEKTEKSRGLDTVMSIFDIAEEDFEDGKTLDIGSGNSVLAQDLHNTGSVLSIDRYFKPNMSQRRHFYSEEALDGAKDKFVYANSGAIPYKGGTFRRVIDLFTTPYYAETEEQTTESIKEMLRVLEGGGSLYIYPVIDIFSNAPHDDFLDDSQQFPFRNRDRFESVLSKVLESSEGFYQVEFKEKEPPGRKERTREGVRWYRVIVTKKE